MSAKYGGLGATWSGGGYEGQGQDRSRMGTRRAREPGTWVAEYVTIRNDP